MKPSVRRALIAVAAAGDEAAVLAQELSGKDDPKVQDLIVKISALQAQISLLHMRIVNNHEMLNEGQVVLMRDQFLHHLANVPDGNLSRQFDRNFFLPHTNQVRVVLATTLINLCHQRKINPTSFWVDIAASNGEL